MKEFGIIIRETAVRYAREFRHSLLGISKEEFLQYLREEEVVAVQLTPAEQIVSASISDGWFPPFSSYGIYYATYYATYDAAGNQKKGFTERNIEGKRRATQEEREQYLRQNEIVTQAHAEALGNNLPHVQIQVGKTITHRIRL